MPDDFTQRPARRRVAAVYLVLLALGIPWYWPALDRSMLFGVPAWVVVAVAVSVVASIFTAWVYSRPWPGETKDG